MQLCTKPVVHRTSFSLMSAIASSAEMTLFFIMMVAFPQGVSTLIRSRHEDALTPGGWVSRLANSVVALERIRNPANRWEKAYPIRYVRSEWRLFSDCCSAVA